MSKRDSEYYLQRLKKVAPHVYRDFKAGRYDSLNAALRAAGLRRPRTPLHELRNAWRKASSAERRTFLKEVRAGLSGVTPNVAAVDNRLTLASKGRIREIMTKRRLSMGDLMRELGCSPLDASLGSALSSNTRLRPELLQQLEKWLQSNKAV